MAKNWLKQFFSVIESAYPKEKKWTDPEWTEFMKKVMERVAKRMKCYVVQRRPHIKNESWEYLKIDAFFISNSDYERLNKKTKKGWDPFVLPQTVIELENSNDKNKISYCLWKILCIRAPLRVLICYQNGTIKVSRLRKHLEGVIRQGRLMKGAEGDLLVIIGDDSVKEDAKWDEYFCTFQWQNDRLEKVKLPEW